MRLILFIDFSALSLFLLDLLDLCEFIMVDLEKMERIWEGVRYGPFVWSMGL